MNFERALFSPLQMSGHRLTSCLTLMSHSSRTLVTAQGTQPWLEAAGIPGSGQGMGHGDDQLRARVRDPYLSPITGYMSLNEPLLPLSFIFLFVKQTSIAPVCYTGLEALYVLSHLITILQMMNLKLREGKWLAQHRITRILNRQNSNPGLSLLSLSLSFP